MPATALFQKGGEPAVWVVVPDLTVELRPVTVERYESDRVLVAAGLRGASASSRPACTGSPKARRAGSRGGRP